MHVLAIASRKGGVGKTTLAGHLAVQAERCGAGPVAVADVDPQGSLADWWNARAAPTPVFLRSTARSLTEDVERLRDLGIALLVIDTPPALGAIVAEVVRLSDLVLIPTRPSPHDLRSIGATVELVEDLGKPLVFVVNGATARARITAETITVLSQHGTLAPAIVHQRVDFAASMVDGRTVMELPGVSRSAEEIAGLWDYIGGRLGGRPRRPLPVAATVAVGDEARTPVTAEMQAREPS
ncbi:MAG: ParA family protein [Dongiaceae bacterium]